MRFALVIPAYNEAATIADVVVRSLRCIADVIVVDDGSTDATAERLAKMPVTVLRHERNLGKSASLIDGLALAVEKGAAAVITMDGDGQHPPEEIPRLVRAAIEKSGSIIIAARSKRSGAPWLRRFANKFADFWVSWAAGCPMDDTQSGFRVYPAELITRIARDSSCRTGFVFESRVLIDAARAGWRISSVSVEALYSPHARRSHYRPLLDTWQITRMVAAQLARRGLDPVGLSRSRGWIKPIRR